MAGASRLTHMSRSAWPCRDRQPASPHQAAQISSAATLTISTATTGSAHDSPTGRSHGPASRIADRCAQQRRLESLCAYQPFFASAQAAEPALAARPGSRAFTVEEMFERPFVGHYRDNLRPLIHPSVHRDE